MLHLVFGRAGSGKTGVLLESVAAFARERSVQNGPVPVLPESPVILLLVPETASHDMERRLAAVCGDRLSPFAEVVTFRRLTSRVFAHCGGAAGNAADDAARLLLMYEAFTAIQPQLQVYSRLTRSCELLRSLLSIYDECSACCITPERLAEVSALCGSSALARKMTDLSLLFAAYDSRVRARLEDPRSELERAAERLSASGYLRGAVLCIDGFEGFTPREKDFLALLVTRCSTVCAAFSAEPDADPDSVFRKSAATAAWLERTALDAGHEVRRRVLPPPVRRDALSYLEASYDDYGAAPFAGDTESISLYTAATPYSEAARIAAEIRRLLREEGLRLRDCAVALPDPASMSAAIEAAFGQYGLPFYVSQKTDILQTSIASVSLAALDAVTGNYETDDVFQYIKTGFARLAPAEWDALENYTLLWNVTRFTAKAWTMHPEGLGKPRTPESAAALAAVNRSRETVMRPLLALEKGISGNGTCGDKAHALYAFFEEIGLPAACSARERSLRSRGELAEAEEYRQLWDILCRALDSFASVLGDKPCQPRQFASLWRLALGQYTVSAIPAALDRVHICPMENTPSVKRVFLAGCTETALPGTGRGKGLLTDDDREQLADLGLPLQTTPEIRGMAVRFGLYTAMSAAKEHLYLSYPQSDSARESMPVARIRFLFPGMACDAESVSGGDFRLCAPSPALEYALTASTAAAKAARAMFAELPVSAAQVRAAEEAASLQRGPVSPGLMHALAGDQPRFSATTLETFNDCRYRHFAEKTLALQPRRPAEFDALAGGNYFHFVLDHTVREVQEKYGSWRESALEDVLKIGEKWSSEYLLDYLGDPGALSARQKHLLQRTRHQLELALTDLYAEFSVSQFVPLDFELEFSPYAPLGGVEVPLGNGVTMTLTGKADRVDGWLHQGALYLRVVDYKSTGKDFDFAQLAAGAQLQLPLYLLALEERFDTYLKTHGELPQDAAMRPAGLLYKSLKEPLVHAEAPLSDDALLAEQEKLHKASGLVLHDPDLIRAMDERFIPVKLKKDSSFSATSSTAGLAQFRDLRKYVRKLLAEAGRAMLSGANEASPVSRGMHDSCSFCQFRSICQFDPEQEKLRTLPSFSRETFFDMIREGEEEEPHAETEME